jgi:hypothetical protein
MKLHQRIERAREEIVRLNVEVRRLYTAIHDEHILFAKVRLELERAGQYELLGALTDLVTERKGVNMSILRYLEDIKGLHGYSGSKDLLGLRQGATARDEGAGPMGRETPSEGRDEDIDSGSEAEDEEEIAQRGGVLDFISEMAVS